MQTSHFQFGLIATLAVGLGFSLASSDAVGYPAGSAVSYGANPLFAVGGAIAGTDVDTVLTAPSDQLMVVTDLIVTAWDEADTCTGHSSIEFTVDGVLVASFDAGLYRPAANYSSYQSVVDLDLRSGIPVGVGKALVIESSQISQAYCSGSDIEFRYTITGYYSQP